MKNSPIFEIFRSNWCKVVFLISLIVGYFTIPKNVLNSNNIYLAIIFIILFSLTITCTTRAIKEKAQTAKSSGVSFSGIIASILGISALQLCGMSASICSASIGTSVVAIIFPGVIFNFMHKYSVEIIYISIIAQLVSLYFLKCFSFIKNKK